MDILRRQVRRAWRTLLWQQFCAALAWSLFVALLVAMLAIVCTKIWPAALWGASESARHWALSWLGGCALAAFFAAGLWTWFRRAAEMEAAIEIDRRFGLKERISSTLALSSDEAQTPIGAALIEDAVRRLENVELRERFAWRPRWPVALPLAPAAIAIALMLFVESKSPETLASTNAQVAQTEQVRTSAKALQKKLEERRKKAEEQKLTDAEQTFKKLEEGTRELTDKNKVDRKQALVKLNDLSKELEERREKLSGDEQLKKQLDGLKDLGAGPGEKVAKSIAKGDFAQAKKELDKLKQQLKDGKLGEDEKKQLAQQLQKLSDHVDKAAEQHREAKETLKREIEKQRQAGDLAKAEKLQSQLDKLQKQSPQMEKLQKACSQCKNAAESMKKGDSQQAQAALDELASELDKMQRESAEREMLSEALDQIKQTKESMTCPDCKGKGCEACEGKGRSAASKNGPPGKGLGEGRGSGRRPEEREKTALRDSNVRQNVGQGGASVVDFVDGPNRKGQSLAELKSEMTAAKTEESDPLSGQQLPRDYREHAQKYFDSLREGK